MKFQAAHFTLFIFLSVVSVLRAQQAVDTVDIAITSGEKYYTRFAFFDSHRLFVDQLSYDAPGVDEEFTMSYCFAITKKDSIHPGSVLDVSGETSLVKNRYSLMSVWIWDDNDSASFKGTLHVISCSWRKVVIEEDVWISSSSGRLIHFNGTRAFRRKRKI